MAEQRDPRHMIELRARQYMQGFLQALVELHDLPAGMPLELRLRWRVGTDEKRTFYAEAPSVTVVHEG